MRTLLLLIAVTLGLLASCQSSRQASQASQATSTVALRFSDTVLLIPARPRSGFNFPYFIYLPKGMKAADTSFLLVETNNGGPNDSLQHHERTARSAAAKSGVANYVSKYLRLPLLVPVFPRSATHWEYYTHALDRDALLSKDFGIERLDLQLLAMVKDARRQLAGQGYRLREKFLMAGFSASGTFANRFSLLHPEQLQAVAAGGINGIAILPVDSLKGQRLEYPLGTADVRAITGKPVNHSAFRRLPQLLFMGALDSNDAVAYDDAYSDTERVIVYRLLGQALIPQRWKTVGEVYMREGVAADIRTYPHIGHGTDQKINNDVVAFFRVQMARR